MNETIADLLSWLSNATEVPLSVQDRARRLMVTKTAEIDPDCLHCVMAVATKDFLGTHPSKSNADMAAEVLQFAAQFVVYSTPLNPEEAVNKFTLEMRRSAVEWLQEQMPS